MITIHSLVQQAKKAAAAEAKVASFLAQMEREKKKKENAAEREAKRAEREAAKARDDAERQAAEAALKQRQAEIERAAREKEMQLKLEAEKEEERLREEEVCLMWFLIYFLFWSSASTQFVNSYNINVKSKH